MLHRYRRVLRHPDFRYLFAGQSVSAVGDRLVVVALALLVTQRTGSAPDLGLILAAQTLPLVGLLLIGGVWADRLPRQRIMIATDLVRAALHALLAVLILAGTVVVWQLVVIEALFGAAQAFFQPAYTGLIPQTVSEDFIQDARALTETTANLAFLVGPAIATALVLTLGAGEAFAFDAATFLVSVALLRRVRPRRRGSRASDRRSLWGELRSGWGEVRARPWVAVTIAVFTGSVLTVYAQWYALAPEIARNVYGRTAIFGVLETLTGVGAVVGALVAVHWRPRRPLVTGLLLTMVWPLNDLAFALALPLPLIVVSTAGLGFGFSLLGIWWETLLAQHIPPEALSRVSAWDWMGSLALLPLGFLIAGPLAAAIGARLTLGAGSAIGLLLLLVGLLPRSTRALGYAAAPEPGSPRARGYAGAPEPSSSRATSA